MKLGEHRRHGLSGFDVACVLAAVALLAIVVLPRFARASSGRRLGCSSNLKQIGLGFRLYANNHDEQFPFAIADANGSKQFSTSPEVFRHFAILSNELVNPRILVCPQDKRMKAPDFTVLSNRNLSYFAALDADESNPERLLAGDRNITGGVLSNGFLRLLRTNTPAGWTKELHNKAGNVALSDGSLTQTDPQLLRDRLAKQTLPVIRLAIP